MEGEESDFINEGKRDEQSVYIRRVKPPGKSSTT
jgi:hypothetical protein